MTDTEHQTPEVISDILESQGPAPEAPVADPLEGFCADPRTWATDSH